MMDLRFLLQLIKFVMFLLLIINSLCYNQPKSAWFQLNIHLGLFLDMSFKYKDKNDEK